MTIRILRDEKLELDYVDNPEGLPYIDIIVREIEKGRIRCWSSIDKEQTEEIIVKLQELLKRL